MLQTDKSSIGKWIDALKKKYPPSKPRPTSVDHLMLIGIGCYAALYSNGKIVVEGTESGLREFSTDFSELLNTVHPPEVDTLTAATEQLTINESDDSDAEEQPGSEKTKGPNRKEM